MKQSLDAQIDELYHLPLEEFTKARNALAKSQAGSEKKRIGSLVKPSLPMWIINQLYWQDAPTYRALVDAAEKLRTAHRSALSGHKTDTRKPDQLHRTTIEKAFAKAIGIAEKGGGAVTDSVRDTVRRTLAALPGDEPDGRLTRPPEPAGFSLLSGVKILPESKVQESRVESRKSSAREELEARKRAERERKEAERKARHEQQEREKREREIRKAEQALRDAERRLAELKG